MSLGSSHYIEYCLAVVDWIIANMIGNEPVLDRHTDVELDDYIGRARTTGAATMDVVPQPAGFFSISKPRRLGLGP